MSTTTGTSERSIWLEAVELLTRAADQGIGQLDNDLRTHSLALGAQLVASMAIDVLAGHAPPARVLEPATGDEGPVHWIRAAAVAVDRLPLEDLPPEAFPVLAALDDLLAECPQ